MTSSPETRPAERAPEAKRGIGLRLRLWIGCLGASLVAGVGLWWVISAGAEGLPEPLFLRLSSIAFASLLAGIGFALWLDRGIVGYLRRLTRTVAQGQSIGPRGIRGSQGWGELADVTYHLRILLSRNRQLMSTAEELQTIRRQIVIAREAIDRWTLAERWEGLQPEEGWLGPLIEALNRGFARQGEVSDQNQEASRQVRSDLGDALEGAREAAEQAERSFVESTALLTTVRELQRLSLELMQATGAGDPAAESQIPEGWRTAAAEAIQELVEAANRSVEHLASGLMNVHGIAEQVQVLSNRATLIALNALTTVGRAEGGGAPIDQLAGELKQLARDVRGATDRVGDLSRQIDRDVAAASQRMMGLKERVAARLDRAAALSAPAPARRSEEMDRILGRVREMVQDANRKGERLSAAGERASRAAEAVARRLEEELRDVEGLVMRLTPPGMAPEPTAQMRGQDPGRRGREFRLHGGEESRGLGPRERGREERQ